MDSKKLPISGPCPVEFDRSTFEGQTRRFCDHCQKNVHNLSAMSRGEARDFLKENAGKKLCVTYRHDKGGKIAFKSSPPPTPAADFVPAASLVRRSRPAATKRSLPMAPRSASLGLAAALAACTPHAKQDAQPETDPVEVVETPQIDTDPIPEPLAGAVAIPEDIEVPEPEVEVEGEMMVPMGDMEVPEPEALGELEVEEPCDGDVPVLPYQPHPTAEPVPQPEAEEAPVEHVRGRMALPPRDTL